MQLEKRIIQILREVYEHDMSVMQGFESISEELSKEFDRIEDERLDGEEKHD